MFEGFIKGIMTSTDKNTDKETGITCAYCNKSTEYMGTISRKSDGKEIIYLCTDCLDRLEKALTDTLKEEPVQKVVKSIREEIYNLLQKLAEKHPQYDFFVDELDDGFHISYEKNVEVYKG